MVGAISQDRESCQFHFCLMKTPVLLRSARAAQRSVGRKVFQFAPLARNQSERLRRLALATGLGGGFWGRCFLTGQTSGQIFETPSGEPRRGLGAIKGDANLFLNFGPTDIAVWFRDRQDRQIRGPQFRSAGFDLRGKPRAAAPHRPPRKPWTSRKSDDEKSRSV